MTPASRRRLVAKGEGNALVYRDYSMDGGAVSVALLDDRLEIWDVGLVTAP